MTMPEDEEIDIGMCLKIFFGENDQVFGRFPFIFLCILFLQTAFAAVERPSEGKTERPAGMDTCIQPLAEFITENGTDKPESLAAVVHLVTMSEEETLTQQVGR